MLGYRVARFTWLDLEQHRDEVIAMILGLRSARMTAWVTARSSR